MGKFNLKTEMANLFDSCGGEDLVRWLLKDDGVIDWDTIKLYPIIAYSPKHLDNPIAIGFTHKVEGDFRIVHAEFDFDSKPIFQEYVKYLLEMGNYKEPIEALIDHKRALIADDNDILDGELLGWKTIMNQVIKGIRDNNENKLIEVDFYDINEQMMTNSEEEIFSHFINLFDKLFMQMAGMDATNIKIECIDPSSKGFDADFQEEWA
tara:strand:- start:4116 stop:4739 length:624 start_codon:yes stop_codon:yes gene_type:complete